MSVNKDLPDGPGEWHHPEHDTIHVYRVGCGQGPNSGKLAYNALNDEGAYNMVGFGVASLRVRGGWHKAVRHRAPAPPSPPAARLEEVERLACGHPADLLVKSVESNYEYCELCECQERLSDAIVMERHNREQARKAESALAAAEQRASRLGNQLESVCGALVDAGNVLAIREDGDYGASVRQVVEERDKFHARAEHLETWSGLMEVLDKHYPADVFDGSSGDPGARIVVLIRQLAAAQERVAALRGALREIGIYALAKTQRTPHTRDDHNTAECSWCNVHQLVNTALTSPEPIR